MEDSINNKERIKVGFSIWQSVKFGIGIGAGVFLWTIILLFVVSSLFAIPTL